MAKIIMSPPAFGWFDNEYNMLAEEFHPNECSPYFKGVSVIFSVKNNTGRTIKYLHFWFVAYDGVGEQVDDRQGVKFTGPLVDGGIKNNVIFSNAWHSNTIKTVKVLYVRVDYMDGTTESLNADEIEYSLSKFTRYIPQPTTNASGGCYVATAVYGSYDCPEVWTLRRYRDLYLAKSLLAMLSTRNWWPLRPLRSTALRITTSSKAACPWKSWPAVALIPCAMAL